MGACHVAHDFKVELNPRMCLRPQYVVKAKVTPIAVAKMLLNNQRASKSVSALSEPARSNDLPRRLSYRPPLLDK